VKYVIVHHHTEKLVVGQTGRDLLFSTGNLLALVESDLHSLQEEHFQRFKCRPLGLILWGVADRYGVVPPDVEVFEARNWSDCYGFCRDLRPRDSVHVTEEGNRYQQTEWLPVSAA
jgi:hypothetical protein